MLARLLAVAVALALSATSAFAQPAPPIPQTCADSDAVCFPAEPAPAIEVAGVQATPDDARLPDESEPFIINDGFGD
jgi:hypothetical protein